MRLPMSIIVQPTSRTIDSPATPDSVSIPASVCAWADASSASASASESGGSRPQRHRALHRGQHHPGVVGQLVAHRPGGQRQPVHRLHQGSRPVRVHGQRPQRRGGDGDHLGRVVDTVAVDPVSVPVIRPSAAISTGTHSLSSVSWWCR